MIERWQRSIKSSIKCQEATDWKCHMGLQGVKEDIKTTAAEMVLGTTHRLPGEFFIHEEVSLETEIFVETHHCRTRPFAHKTLYTCSHDFVRVDSVQKPCEQPYKGPYEVLERISDYVFNVNIQGTPSETISTERLKPAFYENFSEDIEKVTPRCFKEYSNTTEMENDIDNRTVNGSKYSYNHCD